MALSPGRESVPPPSPELSSSLTGRDVLLIATWGPLGWPMRSSRIRASQGGTDSSRTPSLLGNIESWGWGALSWRKPPLIDAAPRYDVAWTTARSFCFEGRPLVLLAACGQRETCHARPVSSSGRGKGSRDLARA